MAFATIGTRGIQAQSVDLSSKVTGTLPVPNGGLGIASGTTGQFLKFTGTETLASAADNAGKILQVQSSIRSTETVTTNGSYIDTGLSVNITPSSTSSKILVMIGHGMNYTSSGTEVQFRIKREIGASVTELTKFVINLDGQGSTGGSSIMVLDTPNTTSQVSYLDQFYRSNGSGNVYLCVNNSSASITAMEIGA